MSIPVLSGTNLTGYCKKTNGFTKLNKIYLNTYLGFANGTLIKGKSYSKVCSKCSLSSNYMKCKWKSLTKMVMVKIDLDNFVNNVDETMPC